MKLIRMAIKFNILFLFFFLAIPLFCSSHASSHRVQEKDQFFFRFGYCFPNELTMNIILYLDIKSIGKISEINKNLYNFLNDPYIWKNFANDYPFLNFRKVANEPHYNYRLAIADEEIKQKILTAFLSGDNSEKISNLSKKLSQPLKLNEVIKVIIEYQIHGLYSSRNTSSETIRNINEKLLLVRDPDAILRKIQGLSSGFYGYSKDLKAAREFNEQLIKEGDFLANERKYQGFLYGFYGYRKNLKAARKFNKKFGKPLLASIKIKKMNNFPSNLYHVPICISPKELGLTDQLAESGDKEEIIKVLKSGNLQKIVYGKGIQYKNCRQHIYIFITKLARCKHSLGLSIKMAKQAGILYSRSQGDRKEIQILANSHKIHIFE